MPSPERRRDLVALAVLGLLVNTLAARWVSLPGYTDAYYYFNGAVQIGNGSGLTEPYLWNYLAPRDPADDALHRWPSHLYWMPLASLIGAPFVAAAQGLAGRGLDHPALFRAAQVPFIMIASALPLISYSIAVQVGGRRRHGWAAALLTLFSAYYFIYWTTTDTFAIFGVCAAAALWLGGLARDRPQQAGRLLAAAGIFAGLAHLARADGVLVGLCLGAWWWMGWRGRAQADGHGAAPPEAPVKRRDRLWQLLALAAGYAGVMLPWVIRNLAVIGSPVAPGAARTLWLVHYDQFFTFEPERLTLAAYLASGWKTILSGKLDALLANLATLAGVQANVVALPLAAVGGWRLRREPLMWLAAFYGLAVFGLMTLAFSFPGARGGYFHSGAALLPFLLTAAVVGLDVAVDAAARRLPHWQPERAKPIFAVLLVLLVIGVALALFASVVVGPRWRDPAWGRRDAVYAEAGWWLDAQPAPEAVVAVNNPPGWYYHTGLAAIVIPAGDEATLLRAMESAGARWLLIDRNLPAELMALYGAPGSNPRLVLRETFADSAGGPVYLLEHVPTP